MNEINEAHLPYMLVQPRVGEGPSNGQLLHSFEQLSYPSNGDSWWTTHSWRMDTMIDLPHIPPSPVPEPASWVAMVAGILFVSLVQMLKRNYNV